MSKIRFIPVEQITDPLTVTLGLSGTSGTGKTYSALAVAKGLAEGATGTKGAPIGYVDTENRRALHYKQAFPEMLHFDMKAVDETGKMIGFGPERWIEVIDAAEAAKLPVLVIDSFSHAWEGVGGVLDAQAQALDRLVEAAVKRANGRDVNPDSYNQLSWAEVKPPYRRLIDRIVRANCHMVICTRAKPVMQKGFGDRQTNARPTKTRRSDVPWDVAGDGDLMFEMTAMMMLDPKAPGCPVHQIKCADQFKGLFDPRRPMGVDTGLAMAEWARGKGDAQAAKAAMDAARDAARKGKAAFSAWWNDPNGGAPIRHHVRPIMQEIEALAGDAESALNSNDDNPFARSAAAPTDPTPEQIEAAMREAEAASRASIQSETA
jgi:hypothetical protein